MAIRPRPQNPFRVRPTLAAAMVAAALALPATPAAADATSEIILILGGVIADPEHTAFVEDASDGTIPQLPIVYEDDRGE